VRRARKTPRTRRAGFFMLGAASLTAVGEEEARRVRASAAAAAAGAGAGAGAAARAAAAPPPSFIAQLRLPPAVLDDLAAGGFLYLMRSGWRDAAAAAAAAGKTAGARGARSSSERAARNGVVSNARDIAAADNDYDLVVVDRPAAGEDHYTLSSTGLVRVRAAAA